MSVGDDKLIAAGALALLVGGPVWWLAWRFRRYLLVSARGPKVELRVEETSTTAADVPGLRAQHAAESIAWTGAVPVNLVLMGAMPDGTSRRYRKKIVVSVQRLDEVQTGEILIGRVDPRNYDYVIVPNLPTVREEEE